MTDLSRGVTTSVFDDAGAITAPRCNGFKMYCRECAANYVVAESRIESKHQSAEGLVGYVWCPVGHLAIHQFTEAYPKPPPPQAVIDRRAPLAAVEPATAELVAGNE